MKVHLRVCRKRTCPLKYLGRTHTINAPLDDPKSGVLQAVVSATSSFCLYQKHCVA